MAQAGTSCLGLHSRQADLDFYMRALRRRANVFYTLGAALVNKNLLYLTMTTINVSTPQLKAVQRWIDAYLSLDIHKIELLFSKDFRHQTFPKSVGLSEETREEHLKRFGKVLPIFTSFKPTIHDVIEGQGRVVVHATDICSTIYGITLTYETVYTMTLVEEDGELKFSRIEEFVDSQEYRVFFEKIAKVAAEEPVAS